MTHVAPDYPTASPEVLHLGMDEADLTVDVWRGVVAAYHEVALERAIPERDLEFRYAALPTGGDFRLGSVISPHSKLKIRDNFVDTDEGSRYRISFDFQVNDHTAEDPDTERGRRATAIQQAFRQRIDELLMSLGIAQPLA